MDFSNTRAFLSICSEKTESNLERYYKNYSGPPQLIEAIRYASLGGGKKIRPALIYASAETYQLNETLVHDIACATELIHAYSLIHDDLPSMDNDDFRRGKPTVHKKFGEAIAILAGDAMHALAFEILAKSTALKADHKVQIIALLAHTTGIAGMCGGQVIDIRPNPQKGISTVIEIHRLKTGTLIASCIETPWICANGVLNAKERTLLKDFSRDIGLCFQIRDDILDYESDSQNKQANSPRKLTYPLVIGLEQSKLKLRELEQQCLRRLTQLNHPIDRLIELTHYISQRPN